MQGNIDIVTLLSLVVAIIVILKLRSVLGRRTGEDEARIDRQMRARQAREQAAAAGEKVVTLPRRENDDLKPAATNDQANAEFEERVKSLGIKDRDVEAGLMSIAQRDPTFDPDHFMSGAKQAYEMIVTAFAEGNKGLLNDLLNSEVFEGFASAISDRDSRGEQVDQSFVGINKADIIEADLKGTDANVTVKFLSQLISATRDRDGEVISGDPQRVMEVTDIWTFARDTASSNPNWKLIATQAPS
ncbi:MAG: Tim44/TimA family putative adaptor protein [Hyphomicrobiaceae bacterium]